METCRRMRWGTWVLWALAAAGTGCSTQPDGGQPVPVQTGARLVSFESCETLEGYIEDTAVQDMRAQLEQIRRSWDAQARGGGGPFMGGTGGLPGGPEGDVTAAPSAPAAGAADAMGAAAPDDYTDRKSVV